MSQRDTARGKKEYSTGEKKNINTAREKKNIKGNKEALGNTAWDFTFDSKCIIGKIYNLEPRIQTYSIGTKQYLEGNEISFLFFAFLNNLSLILSTRPDMILSVVLLLYSSLDEIADTLY